MYTYVYGRQAMRLGLLQCNAAEATGVQRDDIAPPPDQPRACGTIPIVLYVSELGEAYGEVVFV